MSGPEYGSGRHGTHNSLITMPESQSPTMTPEERLDEIARVFARAYLRFRLDGSAIPPLPEMEKVNPEQKETDQ